MKVIIKKAPNAKSGAAFSPEKAKKILREKNPTLQGHPITAKQKRWLGWQAGGAKADGGASLTPLTDNVAQFNGKSHEEGGIPISYGGKQVEVEGGETAYKSPMDDSLHIMGNMINPLSGKKFKQDSKQLAEKEKKVDKLIKVGNSLVHEKDPGDRWEQLAFNSGDVMLKGGLRKKQELQQNKEWLATLQKTMLEHANELGVDPQEFSKGTLTKARGGYYIKKGQAGYTLDPNSPLNDTHIDKGFRDAFIQMMSNAPDYVQKGVKIGSGYRTNEEQQQLYTQGLQKYGPQGIRTRVAQPGRSPHEFGLAGDFQFLDPRARQWVHSNSNKYGIDFPLKKDDPNHGVFVKNLQGNRWTGPQSMTNYGPEDITTYPPTEVSKNFLKFDPTSIKYPEAPTQRGASPTSYDLNIQEPKDYIKPTNASKFNINQILPELYTAATNKAEPVWLQQFHPQLFQPYKVSFQDRLNENQASFNALLRANVHNPAAQSALAAQKYEADNRALADEFRTNQGIEQDIVNKNISLLNDAQIKNLQLADTQYVRQAQTRAKVKEQNQVVLDSIAEKLRQHELENKTLKVYENLYPNYSFDENMRLKYTGPTGGEWINEMGGTGGNEGNYQKVTKYNPDGSVGYMRTTEKSPVQKMIEQQRSQNLAYDTIAKRQKVFKALSPQTRRQVLNVGVPFLKK